MRILALRINQEKYVPERIKKEAEKQGHDVDLVLYQNLIFQINPLEVKNLDLSQYQGLILRVAGTTRGGYIAFRNNLISYFLNQGKTCLNGRSYLRFPRLDKLEQHFYFSQAGLPVIKTLCFGKKTKKEEVIEKTVKELGLPVIAKPRFGSQGKGIYLLKSEEEIKKFLKRKEARQYSDLGLWLFQKYLKTGEDFRIIVFRDKILGGMRRIAQEGMVVTNYSQGGEIEPFESEEEQKQLALKTAKLFDLDYAGVDLIKDEKGKNYILEVNRSCQFKGFEKATGINVAGEIVKFLIGTKI